MCRLLNWGTASTTCGALGGLAPRLLVAFASQPPEFPGLLFEKPEVPPKAQAGEKVTYYHPNEKLRRLPGTLYSIVLLDSNGSIFEKAKDDFAYLLKSIRLD